MNQQDFVNFFGLKLTQDVFATILITIIIFFIGKLVEYFVKYLLNKKQITKTRKYIKSSLNYMTHSLISQIEDNDKLINTLTNEIQPTSQIGSLPNIDINVTLNSSLINEIPYLDCFDALTSRRKNKVKNVEDFQLLISHILLSKNIYSQLLEYNTLNNIEFSKRADNIEKLAKESDEIIQDRYNDDIINRGKAIPMNQKLMDIKVNFSEIHDNTVDSFITNYAVKIIELYTKTYGDGKSVPSPVPILRKANIIIYEYSQLIDYKKMLIYNLKLWNKSLSTIKEHYIKILMNELEYNYRKI